MISRFLFALSIVLVQTTFSVFAAPGGAVGVVYVKADASGANDGSSWANAYVDLQTAIQNHPGLEIWVASGVYVPGTQRTSTFLIPDLTRLYGGFAGTETEREERDWGANVTVLSGDIGEDDAVNASGVLLDPEDAVGLNAYHVVSFRGIPFDAPVISPDTVLDGFVVTAGQANGDSWNGYGGGIYCDAPDLGFGLECRPTLSNLLVQGNQAVRGGGLNISANWTGGGVAAPVIRDTIFRRNKSIGEQGSGGAVSMQTLPEGGTVSPLFERVLFDANRSDGRGGALSLQGGFESGGSASAILRDVTFINNAAAIGGGAAWVGQVDSPGLLIERGRFEGNQAVSTNVALGSGGAILQFVGGKTPGTSLVRLFDSEFNSNFATSSGGVLHQDGPASSIFVNTSARGNQSAEGSVLSSNASVEIHNSILWDNPAQDGTQIAMTQGNLTIASSIVQGGLDGSGVALSNVLLTDGGGNLDENPRFISTTNLRLLPGSPAIDTGDNASTTSLSDLDGLTRIHDGNDDAIAIIDMGAYEFGVERIFFNGFEANMP